MENKIPQKAFDAQMHIIRDVHFDVDKYKVGELYVINNSSKHIDDNVWHINVNKVVGILKYVHEKFLTFMVLRYYEHDNTVSYNSKPLKIDIEDIIDKQIEIERLLTETEAAVYLMGAISKECAKDIIPESSNEKPVLADKYKGDLSHFILPNSFGEKYLYTDGTLKNIDMGEKQSTLDPADPKFNRLLGIVPDRSQFPYALERTHSYQELQTAYKIDEETAKECVDFGQIAKDLVEEDPVAEMVKHRDSRYLMSHLKSTTQSLPYVLTFINDKGEFDPTPFKDMVGTIKITMRKGTSEIVWYTAKKNIRIVPNTIEIRNRNGTVQMILTKDTFFLMFDKITFEDQQ